MAVKIKYTDYLYAAARIRAMENKLIGAEKLNALLELRSCREIVAALTSFGVGEGVADGEGIDGILENTLKNGFAEATTACSGNAPFAFLQYPYDCNNIKAMLKASLRGISAQDLLSHTGTVDERTLLALIEQGKTQGVPAHMAAAVATAKEQFAKTGDPQVVDLLLDRACYADMAQAVKGFPFAERALAIRADLTNLLTCLRLLRMGATFPMRDAMLRALVPGGTLAEGFFKEAFDAGEDRFVDLLAATPYAALFDISGEKSLAAIEKKADDLYMDYIRTAKFIPFGAEVAIGYLVGLDFSVKNLRILYAGKAAGLPTETIRERIRNSYV